MVVLWDDHCVWHRDRDWDWDWDWDWDRDWDRDWDGRQFWERELWRER